MLAFLDKIPYGTPRIRRIAFWLLTTLLIWTIIGFLVIPPVLKSVLTSQLATELKRPVVIEKIYFNPYTLHLEVHNLKVNKLEGEGDLLSVGYMDAAPGIASIWELAPVVSYLHLVDLTVDITFFGNGKYSISDLMAASDNGDKPEDAPADEEDEGAVFPFALYGFELSNATILFDDQPHNKKHVISDIFLRVPFTSSIMDKRKEFTQPKFTAVINGDPVELKGRTLPFDESLLTEFELGAVDVDLNQYWNYVPVETPLKLEEGRFTSDISLFFERPDAQRLNLFLGGGGTLSNLKLSDPKEGSVLSLKKLAFQMERFSLGDNALVLTSVTLDSPFFKIIRQKDNAINWATYFPGPEKGEKSPADKTQAEASAFVMDIKQVDIKDGVLDWTDRMVPGEFKRTFSNLNFKGSKLSSYGDTPSQFETSLGTTGTIGLQGKATIDPLSAEISVTAQNIPLDQYAPYFNQAQPMLVDSGLAGISADINFSMVDGKPKLLVSNGTLSLNNFKARKPEAKDPSLELTALNVSGIALDLDSQKVDVAEVKVTGPAVTVVREKDGKIDLQKLLAPESAVAEEIATEVETASKAKDDKTWSGGWQAEVAHVVVEEGDFRFMDASLKHPAKFGINKFKFELTDLSTLVGKSMPYTMSGNWSGRGSFSLGGKVSVDPLWSNGRLRLNGFGLKPFDGYVAEFTELIVGKGRAYANLKYTFKGGDKPRYTVNGDTSVQALQVKDTISDTEVMGFDEFALHTISFANEPNRLTIGEVNLKAPMAIVEIFKDGQMNIKRALRIAPDPAPKEGTTETATAKKAAPPTGAESKERTKPDPKESFFKTLEINKVSITDGQVKYRDNSVHPFFATDLRDMNLLLTDINQTPEARPKIDFKANIGETPMSVTGALNPVVTPIYSDLAISINGMGLIPLTPYTLHHLAYPIQKGRLYADVTFKTEDWELSAENKFFIEKLELGKKDDSPDAPDVPVEFGLSLLQDGDGNMEINLPIRGRLDDPDFKIGGIVFKAIVSLLFKALSSPFTLIGSMFGGGEDMDFVVFEPGRYALDAAGKQKMDTIVKALTEREKLTLEVDGVVDSNADKTGLVKAFFERKVKQMKYDDLSRDEQLATSVDAVTFDSPEDYEEWLYEAYAAEPDEEDEKPTTLFITDRQPVNVMEKFIRDRTIITDEDLHELALLRAKTVKDYIVAANPALADRVFLLDKEDAQGKTGVPSHRADLGVN
ncbi:DUF748 domain-containing protein [Pseudodesulfovibrio sediminis]|uniref:DUF748 domain-containing protein n=1 Tax=Pseudodesulfovibrio sediminis TaxID=2810563 RepID=A0ABM9SE11_9BACT|nr:DUF748 domain-containing protein [Pseudodesulfovibrio sediminis]BCS89706.1 hypothetical protein PSDVSF_29480 [Pseudodesulfovibrio sediminis]